MFRRVRLYLRIRFYSIGHLCSYLMHAGTPIFILLDSETPADTTQIHIHTCAHTHGLWTKSPGVEVSTMSLSSIGLYVAAAHSVWLTFLLCSVILVSEGPPMFTLSYNPPPHPRPICNPIPHHAPPRLPSPTPHFSKTNQLSWAVVSLGAQTGVEGLWRVTHGSTQL